jgi:hypothetical protein
MLLCIGKGEESMNTKKWERRRKVDLETWPRTAVFQFFWGIHRTLTWSLPALGLHKRV